MIPVLDRLLDWLAFRLCDVAAWWDRDVWDVPYWTQHDFFHWPNSLTPLSFSAYWHTIYDWPRPDGWRPGRYV